VSVPGPSLVVPPDRLWRIGRRDDPLRFARISQADAALPRAGNRFDVPGGGVLYASTTIQGCLAETLAPFRPSPVVAAAVREDLGYMDPGGIRSESRLGRQWSAGHLRRRATQTSDHHRNRPAAPRPDGHS
jgi:hypothetical protein